MRTQIHIFNFLFITRSDGRRRFAHYEVLYLTAIRAQGAALTQSWRSRKDMFQKILPSKGIPLRRNRKKIRREASPPARLLCPSPLDREARGVPG